MKKLLALLLALCLMVPVFALAEEDTRFPPIYTNAASRTTSEWFSTADGRAMLTVLLAFDYLGLGNSAEPQIFKDSYVLLDEENFLMVACPYANDKGSSLCMYYSAEYKAAFYILFEDIPVDYVVSYYTEESNCTGYKNEFHDVSDAWDEFSATLDSEN